MFSIANSCDHIKLFIFYQFRWLSFWGQPVSQLTFDVYCVSTAASPTTKEGYSTWDEASERCCCGATCQQQGPVWWPQLKKKIKDLGENESCKLRASVWAVTPFHSAVQCWHVAPARLPVPLKKKEICVSRLKIHRWWNVPRREECALSFLANRGINWTHFLLPFTGDQQKGNSSDLLGRGRGCIPRRGVLFGVWCRAGIGSCWGCLHPLHQLTLLSCYTHWPLKRQPCWLQLLWLQSFNSFILKPKKLSGSLL